MGKSVKSRHYQKIIWEKVMDGNASKCNIFTEMVADGRASKHDIFTKKSPVEMLPRATYLQKWLQMEGVPSTTYLQKSHGWKRFQAQHMYRKGPRGQDGIGCPLTGHDPSQYPNGYLLQDFLYTS